MSTMGLLTGGTWFLGRETLDVAEKYRGGVYARVALSDENQVSEAVRAAHEAFESSRLTPFERSEILHKAADVIEGRREQLTQDIIGETGFTYKEASGEIGRSVDTLRLSAEEAKRLTGEFVPIEGARNAADKFAFILRVPVGVVCAITPFNSPMNTVLHKVAPAIAAGNTVVIKPSLLTPVGGVRICGIFEEAGLPAGWINMVTGPGETVGMQLLKDERIAFYHFTGSTETGRIIRREIGLRPAALELGNISATVVCRDGDAAKAARQCPGSAFRKAGQVCTSVQLIYVHRDHYDGFCDAFVENTDALVVGDPHDAATDVGPLITRQEAERVETWINQSKQRGGRVLLGDERDGSIVRPTILTDVGPDHWVVEKEVFGPVACVIPFDTLDEVIARCNASPYGLAAGAYTGSVATFSKLARGIRTGTLHINSTSASRVDMMPFGGVKASGNGKEGPHYAIREMTEERLIVLHDMEW